MTETQVKKDEKKIYDLDFLRERVRQKRIEEEARISKLKQELKEEFEEKRKSSRKSSIIEGSFFAVMEGSGSRYISPFALSLGANSTQIGLLTAIPSLVGNYFQIFSVKAMEKYPRKKIIITATTLQAIAWLFVLFAGVMFFIFNLGSFISVNYLIIVYTLLVALGTFVAPIWASWMKDLVDYGKSGKYFGTRNKIIGFVGLLVMLASGFVLDYFKKTKIFIGFFILFACAFLARTISSQLFRKHYEPKLHVDKSHYFSFWQFIKKARGNNFGRFVIYIAIMNFVISLASPFFVVYMLKELGFNYLTYTIIITSSIVGNLIFMPLWGKFADRHGNIMALKISSLLTAIVPLAWFASFFLFKENFYLIYYLIAVEFISGVVFAGFSLASTNFIYDAVTRQKMALCTAYFNISNGVMVFFGATIAGLFVTHIHFGFISTLLVVFLISGILRIFVSLFFVTRINEVRMVEPFKFVDVQKRLKGLTPGRLWQQLDVINFKAE